MGDFLSVADLTPFATIDPAKAAAMIEDAEAMTILTAPCLSGLPADDPKRPAVRAILRGAVLRWHDAGSGAFQTTSTQTGPFGQSQGFDTRQVRKGMFWPSEIEQLQGLCSSGEKGKAFSIDTAGGSGAAGHAPWCSLMFLGDTCSCGASLTAGQFPLYEPF